MRWYAGACVQEAPGNAIYFYGRHDTGFLGRAIHKGGQPYSRLPWWMCKRTVEAYDGSIVCHVRNRQVWVDVAVYHAHFSPAVCQAQLPSRSSQYFWQRSSHKNAETYCRRRESSCRNLCSQLDSCDELSGSRRCRSWNLVTRYSDSVASTV